MRVLTSHSRDFLRVRVVNILSLEEMHAICSYALKKLSEQIEQGKKPSNLFCSGVLVDQGRQLVIVIVINRLDGGGPESWQLIIGSVFFHRLLCGFVVATIQVLSGGFVLFQLYTRLWWGSS